MSHYYKLEDKKIVACSFDECKDLGHRVSLTKIGQVKISTVFLAINHNFTDDPVPLVFETMVFGGENDMYCERYSTWQDAEEGHERVKAMVLHKYKQNKLWSRIVHRMLSSCHFLLYKRK